MLRLLITAIISLIVVSVAIPQDTHLPLILGGNATEGSTPTATATMTNTGSVTPTGTPTATGTTTSTPTTTPTFTPTGTATATGTTTNTPTQTPSPTSTSTGTPTATGTTTSTPTTTPTVTPTPTTTATDVAKEMTVLNNHLAYVSGSDSLHIVGEVQNNTGNRARFIKVTANLFNGQNQLVDTEYTYTALDPLPVGETTCFDVLFFFETPAYNYYTFEISYSETNETLLPIALFGDSGSYNSSFPDWYDVVGQARNDSNVNAEFVKIIGTLYQDNGQVLDCDYTYTNADVLSPGQVSTWKITFLHAPNGSVSSYKLQAQGRAE